MNITRRNPALASALVGTALVGTLALTGCTLELSPDGARSTTAASPAPETSAPAPESTAPGADEQTDDGGEALTEGDAVASREQYRAAASQQITCPTGTVDVQATAQVVELVDDCDTVTVSADGGVLVARSIGSLTITGAVATVFVDDIGSITVDVGADAATVLWESGNPTITDASIASTLLPIDQMVSGR
ncbi:hypothetical protein MN032_18300 [Agromyces atrinae]|uniref:hypothetical protein n=1 Tax=Agromyces atrinae TaxID=592376 RepID=UPI001F5910CB|nr:hypothetical protein [Agromyces atrinae]MCI2959640.1 hypothetical protein [Agromyces atrinae]